MATTTQPTDAERARKKPRLSLSTSSSSAAAASSTSRMKSGLPMPSVAASRLHYAFGSRISGKENVANANAKPSTKPPSEPVKKHEPENAKSALKRRPKRRASLLPPLAPEHEAEKNTSATPASVEPNESELKESEVKETHATPPTKKAKHEPVELSPTKPVRFEASSATEPDFWKCRQEYARSAMAELKALEQRMLMLAESPCLDM